MVSSGSLRNQSPAWSMRWSVPRKAIIGTILLVALVAFEVFNFDTTRYALESLLGEVSFWGIHWAAILAVAFCAIDFAGLARLFTPEVGAEEPRSTWYLMGAWLLGATMNAIMTWWAVNLTLLNHDLGNEILSREQLLRFVPLFVAVLVWLTRILFIGAFSVAGEHVFDLAGRSTGSSRGMGQYGTTSSGQLANSEIAGAIGNRPSSKPSGLPTRSQVPVGARPAPVAMQARGQDI